MSERQTVYVTVFSVNSYDDNAPPERVADFIAWLAVKFMEVPEEFRDNADLEIRSEYDSSSVTYELNYFRPATDEELAAWAENERVQQIVRENEERRHLAQLQAKYGQGGL